MIRLIATGAAFLIAIAFARAATVTTNASTSTSDVNAADAFGRTALHEAAKNGPSEIIESLIARGARVNAKDADHRTPLHLANSLSGKILLANGADVMATDRQGNTVLHTAAEEGNVPLCEMIINAGMSVIDARNNSGLSPLHFAILQGQKAAADYLISKGADVNAKTLSDYSYKWVYVAPDVLGMERNVPAGSTPLSIARAEHKTNKWSSGSKFSDLADFLISKGATEPRGLPPIAKFILIPLAPIVFLLFMWALLHVDARMRGWSRLAEHFSATSTPATTIRQDAFVGTAGLFKAKNVMRAAATDEGLYLAMPALLRTGHPPLLIPWSKIHATDNGSRVDLKIDDANATITLRGGVADDVKRHLR